MLTDDIQRVLERLCENGPSLRRKISIVRREGREYVSQLTWVMYLSAKLIEISEPHTGQQPPADLELELRYTHRILTVKVPGCTRALELSSASPAACLEMLFPLLVAAVNRERAQAQLHAQSLCQAILTATLEQVCHPSRISVGKAHRRRETFFALDRFIAENLTSPVSVRDAAKALSLSSTYLNRVCQDYRTLTFSQYANFRRLERARDLLLSNPARKVADLALSCGFNGVGYFVKSFRELYGMPPLRLRKEIRRARGAFHPKLHAVRGFETLPSFVSGRCTSSAGTIPQVTVLVINLGTAPADSDWLSPAGVFEYQGELAVGGRWIIGVPRNNALRVRIGRQQGTIYLAGSDNCQIFVGAPAV